MITVETKSCADNFSFIGDFRAKLNLSKQVVACVGTQRSIQHDVTEVDKIIILASKIQRSGGFKSVNEIKAKAGYANH